MRAGRATGDSSPSTSHVNLLVRSSLGRRHRTKASSQVLLNTSVLSCKMVGKQHIQQKPDSEGMSLSGLLPFPATPLLMVGGPVSGLSQVRLGRLRRLYYLPGKVMPRRWGVSQRGPLRTQPSEVAGPTCSELLDALFSRVRMEQPNPVTVTALQGQPPLETSLPAADHPLNSCLLHWPLRSTG